MTSVRVAGKKRPSEMRTALGRQSSLDKEGQVKSRPEVFNLIEYSLRVCIEFHIDFMTRELSKSTFEHIHI